jgi:4-amino-4-deoxy-L-arabinose transferase-like glycosyltransferase
VLPFFFAANPGSPAMSVKRIDFHSHRTTDPSRGWFLVVLLALFLLPGTLQRDPWKMEDATHFGVVWRALESGDWTFFHLTGGTLAEPPLYYWLSALTGTLLQPLFSAPAAIRSATAIFVAFAAFALFHAARRLVDARLPGAAPLLLAGSLGLLVASHDVQPMTAVSSSARSWPAE